MSIDKFRVLVALAGVIMLTTSPALVNAELQALLWSNTWGGVNYDFGKGVAVGGGPVILGAKRVSAVFIVGTTFSNDFPYGDAFLAKYDLNGNLLWDVTWGEDGRMERGNGVIVYDGMVYIVGTIDTSLQQGWKSMFLAKYDFYGQELWSVTYGVDNQDFEGYGVSAGVSGVYVVGTRLSGGVAGDHDAFLADYDFDGVLDWLNFWEAHPLDKDFDSGHGVAVGGDGVYIVGATNSYDPEYDAFLVKFNFEGVKLWQSIWGTGSSSYPVYDYGYGVAVGVDGVHIVGDSDAYFYAVNRGAFLAKYRFDGVRLWDRIWGGRNYDYGRGVSVGVGGVYIVGYTAPSGAYDHDAFLAKYSYNGKLLWGTTWGEDYDDKGWGIAVSASNIYVTGETETSGATGKDAFLSKYGPMPLILPPRPPFKPIEEDEPV